MIAAPCKARQVEASEDWINFFPANVTEYASSVIFMKQLTSIAVSKIAYSRGLLPKESFQTETLGGIELQILKVKCQDERSEFVGNALTHCFKALEKKYLDKLVLCVYEYDDKLIEAYSFEYKYTRAGGGVTMGMRSAAQEKSGSFSAEVGSSTNVDDGDFIPDRVAYVMKNIREHVQNLLKNCSTLMQSTPTQIRDPYFSLRVYYNNRTPKDYQTPGFSWEPCTASDPVLVALADPSTCDLGSVGTPSHCLRVRSFMHAPVSSLEVNIYPSSDEIPELTEDDYEALLSALDLPPHKSARDSTPEKRPAATQVIRRVRFQE